MKLQALTPSSSLADYTAAVADAKAALAAVKLVAGPFAGAQLTTCRRPRPSWKSAAAALPSGHHPGPGRGALQAPLQAVTQQAVGTYNAICNTHPTPSA